MTDESGIVSNQSVNPDDTTVLKERERALDILARNYPGMIRFSPSSRCGMIINRTNFSVNGIPAGVRPSGMRAEATFE